MQRTLHPVGQGAFYTEQLLYNQADFKDSVLYNVVYDCGSFNRNLLHKKIDYAFPVTSKVDILFISHFDEDHINGIDYLSKRVKRIKCCVMPLLSPAQKIIVFLNCKVDLFNIRAFKQNYNIEKIIEIDRVNPADNRSRPLSPNEPQNNNENRPIKVVDNNGKKELEVIRSGTPLGVGLIPKWCYIPFNICDDSEYEGFEKFLQITDPALFNSLKDLIKIYGKEYSEKESDNLFADWVEIKGRLKPVYDVYIKENSETLSNRNDSSLIVYSGPVNDNVSGRNSDCFVKSITKERDLSQSNWHKVRRDKLVAALYTGDINLNKIIGSETTCRFLFKELKGLAENLGLIQVPHHGSKHNFSTDLTEEFPKVPNYFYSFGLTNSYGHPFPGIRVWLYYDKRRVFEVTEDADTKLTQIIEIY
ncbi:MAG: hypothetical protein J1E97_01020 [Muribaculaceae bacterium]|nr:hypothetical protein [Muribaculaceae bacterium]